MFFCLIGTPSALTDVARHVLRAIVSQFGVQPEEIAVCSIAELKDRWAGRENKTVIFFSDAPDHAIVDTLLSVRVPIAMVVESAAESTRFAMDTRGMDVRVALQFATQSISTLSRLRRSPTCVPFWRSSLPPDAGTFISAFASVFGQPVSGVDVDAVLSRLGARRDMSFPDFVAHLVPSVRKRRTWYEGLSAAEISLILETVEDYDAVFESDARTRLRWPVRLFRHSFQPEQSIDGPIEAVGGARQILFGPILHVPPGQWDVTVDLRVDLARGDGLCFDVVADEAIVVDGEADVPENGVLQLTVPFEVRKPQYPVAFRLGTRRGAIEGQIEVLSALVKRKSVEFAS